MRVALAVFAAAAAVASRGGCGVESSVPPGPPQDSCAGKACGAECVGSVACVGSATPTPCQPASYVGQCDAQGACQPPGTPITCGQMAACDGKACGDACDPCAPAACMSPVAYACDPAHQCVPTAPDLCAPQSAACTYGGTTYPSGTGFPAGDGCNSCSCQNGIVYCTYHSCSGGTWYYTCGDPVLCRGTWTQDPSIPLCTTQKVGDSCTTLGSMCDPQDPCNQHLVCATSDPTMSGSACPISRAKYKTDIRYLDATDLDLVRAELMKTRLATYRYRAAGPLAPTQLGFVIDDVGAGPSVNPDGETVNLYGYTSMAVAALQAQERELAALRGEVASLRRQVEAKAKPPARPRR